MQNRGIGTWLLARRAKAPDAIALVSDESRTESYRDLADRAERVAAALAAAGVQAGERIAFIGENQPAFVEVLFGGALAGVVVVPVNTRLAPPEVAQILADADARLLIHDARAAETARAAAGDVPRLEVGEQYEAALAAAPTGTAFPALSLDDPAVILYTSGTTGVPKGAVLTHGNLTWNALNVIIDVDLVSTDVTLVISPLFHAASLGMGLLPVLMKGGTAVLERGFDAGRALRLIERHRVTMLSGVPTTYQFIAEHPDWPSTDLSSLKKLTCGGSPVPSRVLEAYEARGLSFSQGYGMTETSPGASFLPATMTRTKVGSAGLPHFFTEVRVVDVDGRQVAGDAVGQIEVRGPNVTPGYHGRPDATSEALSADGWFRTGDLGHIDVDGYLFVVDRVKDMIITGGENVYPAEIEDLIMAIPDVTGVAVIGVPDERWGESPWAIVTLREGTTLDVDGVARELDGRVARYKIPKNVVVVDELPRTASGKIRKLDLRRQYGPSL